MQFQSTHPRGVRLSRPVSLCVLLRVSIHAPAWGATYRAVETLLQIRVSIHAPAWGATYGYVPVRPRMPVSIHAPAWGATRIYLHLRITLTGFQSTHPRGVRPFQYLDQCREGKSFNPRTRVGCDASATRHRMPFCAFQSTHPRGVRPCFVLLKSSTSRFNPRTRVGCDLLFLGQAPAGRRVSIHAPAWGATMRREASL